MIKMQNIYEGVGGIGFKCFIQGEKAEITTPYNSPARL